MKIFLDPKFTGGLVAFLGGLGGMIGSLHSWSEAFQPVFVAGLISLLAGFISVTTAAMQHIPDREGQYTRKTDENKTE